MGPLAALSQTATFASFVAAPLLPLTILVVFSVLLWIPGFVATWWWGLASLIGLLWFIALAIGFLMAIVAIGLVGGLALDVGNTQRRANGRV